MTATTPQSILQDVGAMQTDGHFAYTSGRHGRAYINKDAIYPHTEKVEQLCVAMAAPFVGTGVETVAGPTFGGVILAQWVAKHLSHTTGREVVACFAEERLTQDGGRERYFGRGYDRWIRDREVLVVEDILTTGGSARRVVEAVQAAGGTPIAVRAICNRSGIQTADLANCPVSALVDVTFESWEPAECPLCQTGVPINMELGKGHM